MVYPDNIREQEKDKYCPEHEMWKMKNARGVFACPFCAVNSPPEPERGAVSLTDF